MNRKLAVAGALLLAAGIARAALPDEIQVYDDSINRPGQFGLELHVNTTPSGRSQPDYPGEVVPDHGLRVTPELSWGFTETLEGGLYLPFLRDNAGTGYFAGPRLRLKWIPRRPGEGGAGVFYGLNFELSHVAQRFEESRTGLEVRPILGYRDADWLLAFNPVLGFPLSPGYRGGGPDFAPAFKATRKVAAGLAVGGEYYGDLGKLDNLLPGAQQSHSLYAVLDVDRVPWVYELGIGRGYGDGADRWTVKAIFEFPF